MLAKINVFGSNNLHYFVKKRYYIDIKRPFYPFYSVILYKIYIIYFVFHIVVCTVLHLIYIERGISIGLDRSCLSRATALLSSIFCADDRPKCLTVPSSPKTYINALCNTLLHNALPITQESRSDYIVIARPLRRKRSTFTS